MQTAIVPGCLPGTCRMQREALRSTDMGTAQFFSADYKGVRKRMKRRLLAWILAICVGASLLPATALAADAAETGEELKRMIEAAPDDGTRTVITLAADITDMTSAQIVEIGEGQNIVLDMDGYSIAVSEEFEGRPFVNYGTLTIRGKTLHDALSEVISSPAYDAERRYRSDAPLGEESPRSVVIDRIIQTYRNAARRAMHQEFPDIRKQATQKQATEKLSRRGAMTRDNQQDILQQLIQ